MRSSIARRILKETPPEVRQFVRKYGDIVVRINQLLEEKGISRKELAQRLGKNPSEVSKWLSGNHNLTLRTLAKLEAELGEDIIHIPHTVSFDYKHSVKAQFTVYKNTPQVERVEYQQVSATPQPEKELCVA